MSRSYAKLMTVIAVNTKENDNPILYVILELEFFFCVVTAGFAGVEVEETGKPGKVDVMTADVGERVTVLTPRCVSKYVP